MFGDQRCQTCVNGSRFAQHLEKLFEDPLCVETLVWEVSGRWIAADAATALMTVPFDLLPSGRAARSGSLAATIGRGVGSRQDVFCATPAATALVLC